MSTPETCREQAREAEKMAAVVSYERDRERLMLQAAEWRSRADALEAQARAGTDAAEPPVPTSWWRRLSQALFGPRPPRGL